MTHPSAAGRGLLDRAVGVHRLDCAAVAERGVAEGAELAVALAAPASPEAAAYAAAIRPVYDALRRVIGQAAGLLILAAASERREVADLPEIGAVAERRREAVEALAAIRTPAGLDRHRGRIERAAAEIETALAALRTLGSDREAATTAATRGLKTAYALLQGAVDDRYGIAMVDFRQACCTCRPAAAAAEGRA